MRERLNLHAGAEKPACGSGQICMREQINLHAGVVEAASRRSQNCVLTHF